MSGSILDRLSGGDLNSQIANPKGINLLADYAGAAEAARGIWGAREMQARQAAGEVFRNSLNPDGTPNQLRLNQGLAADPRTSLVAQTSSQSGQTLDDQTFDTHMKRLTGVNSAAMALTAQYPNGVPKQAVYDELDRVGPTMGLSPQQIAQAKTSFGDDPQANSMTIIRNGISNLQAQAALHATRPGTGTATGDNETTIGYQTAPAAAENPGAISVPPGQTGVKQGLDVGQGSALQETFVPDPQRPGSYLKVQVPRRNLPGGGGPPVGAAPPIPGDGSYQKPGTSNAAPPGTALAAPPQGVTEGNAADIALYKRDQAAVPDASAATQSLQRAYEALKLTNVGKSTEATHAMYSFLSAQGLVPQGLTDDVKNYDEFRKFTNRYALQQGAASGTDAGRAMTAASNAGTEISTPANFDMLRYEIGRQRMAVAQVLEHKDPSGVGYGGHASKFSSQVDPRGFSAEMYSKPEIDKMLAGMKPVDRDKFYRSIAIAQRNKQIDMPGAAP